MTTSTPEQISPELSAGPARAPARGGAPEQLVLLLHGYAGDGDELMSKVAPAWAEHLPGAAFVAPHGPAPCDFKPGSRQWFGLTGLPLALHERVAALAPRVDRFITEVLARHGLPADRLVLAGFSQGAMLALYVGLRRPQPPAAIVALSGLLVGPGALAGELVSRPPVLLLHGEEDRMIPLATVRAAAATLEQLRVPVRLCVRPRLGHGFDEGSLEEGGRFLRQALGPLSTT